MISNLQSKTFFLKGTVEVQGYLLQWRNFIFEEPAQCLFTLDANQA